MMNRNSFMLAADEIYLNAGTFGAMPRLVYEELVRKIESAELNPTRQAAWRSRLPLWRVQQEIAAYLGAETVNLLFHVNVTQALNQALFCLPWEKGTEFLTSDLEYGAITNAAREMARLRGLEFRTFSMPTHPANESEILDAVMDALSPKTKGLLLSHVTCHAGLVIPVSSIGRKLRKRGIRFIVDGAHGPGLLSLELSRMEIDVYGGNLHKWFMGPKGTAFLHVDPELHSLMQPHVVGWGGTPHDTATPHDAYGGITERFHYVFKMQGLRDVSPFLALPAVLCFREKIGENAIQERIRQLNTYLRQSVDQHLRLECLSPKAELHAGLVAYRPPSEWQRPDATELLYQEHRISVPFMNHAKLGWIMRISPHIYNDEEDIDRFVGAMRHPPAF